MKTYFSTTMYLLLLFSFGNSLSQTAITNKDYEVTDDVVKIQEYRFGEMKMKEISNAKLFYIDKYEFNNGYITSKIRVIEDKAQDIQWYNYNASKNEFSFEENNATYGDNKAQYQLIAFNNLKFYYPKTDFVVIQNKPNILFEFSYSIQGRKITHKLEKDADNFITHTFDDYGNHVDTYNSIGQKVKTETLSLTKSDLLYGTDGLLEIRNTSFGKYVDQIHSTYYSYEKDKKGNWVKRVEIKISPENEIKTIFTSRRITYENDEVTGDGNYDSTFVMWELAISAPDLNDKSTTKTGCISGDCQNGFGKRTYGEKDVYEGGFKEGFRHGKGTYKFANGASYIGEYFNGVMYGKGILKFPNGDLYEGEFKGDQRDGIGTYNFENGNKYEGNWEKGLQHGKGIMYDYIANIKQEAIYNEGKIVEVLSRTTISVPNNKNVSSTSKKTGCISGDCQNGFGTFVGIEGKDTIKIIGNFKNAVFSGYGKSYLNNQLTYDGQWEDFKYHGKGTLYTGDSNEHKFIGEFKNGIKEGPCKMYTNEKLVFEGNYVNNAIEGEGTYYNYKTGKKNVSIYKNGNPIKVISSEPIIVNNQKTTSNSVNTTDKITWKKNETNSYWLYDNGVLKSGGKSFWQGNNLYVYMVDEATLYLLKNYKIETPNTTHQAELLPNTFPNGLWYKTTSGGVIVCNAKGLFVKTIEIYKYDTNGIDVLFKGKDEKETLFLKNFKNVSANVVFPAEVYNASKISNSSSGNLKDKSNIDSYILNCKSEDNEATCLAQKLEEDVNRLQSQGKSQTEINSFLENKMKILANYNVDTLYNTILAFKYNSKTAKLMMPLVKKLPQHQQNRIKELASKTMSDYSKKQQEYQNKQHKN